MEKRFVKREGILEAIFEDEAEALLMRINNCIPYILKHKPALRIWHLLRKPISIEEISAKIYSEFKVSKKRALRDTSKLIYELLKRELIKECRK